MTKHFKHLIALGSILCMSIGAWAQGSIKGIVKDKATGEPLIGVALQIEGSTIGTSTDIDGNYEITGLKAGVKTLRVRLISYAAMDIKGINIENNKVTELNIDMSESTENLNEVTVVAVRRNNSEIGISNAIRLSTAVMSGVSSQMIAKTQDRDAGEVIRRIPGISLIDDRFVVVRGLSQRYNNVWLNNVAIPSSEADSKSFSFDIIPAGQIENMLIYKSPAPEIPAEFTGGFVKISTKDMPSSDMPLSMQYSIGLNTETQFRSFLKAKGSGTDFLGFDNGLRDLNGGLFSILNNKDKTAVTDFTANGMNNNWKISSKSAIPDMKFNFSYGKTFAFDNGGKFSLSSALNYSYSQRSYIGMENSRFGVYNKRDDKPEYLYKYTDDQYTTSVKLGGMLNFVYLQGENKYYFRNIFNQSGKERYTYRDGWQNISSLYLQNKAEYLYQSRTSYSGQFGGSHTINADKLDWNVGYSFADKNAPDRRIINQKENDIVGDKYYGLMGIEQNDIQRESTYLKEHMISGGVNYEHQFSVGSEFTPTLKVGTYGEYRNRNYRARSLFYQFNTANVGSDFQYGNVVNDILQPGNYSSDRLYIYDDTDNRDSYKGNDVLGAAYVGVNLPYRAFNAYVGMRYEYKCMNLINYTRTTEWNTKSKGYTYNDIFPSANATYKLNANNLLRAAYGMSTNRPEFREVSSSVYYDFELFSDIMGNPDLKAAYVHNLDLRYEYYPSAGESVSAALFYKHFKNPIENTFIDAGGSYTYTFENANTANLYGIEIDVRKTLDFIGMRNFSLSLNAALIKSLVKFDANSTEHNRPMQGQSPYIINAGLFYNPSNLGLSAGVLYNRIGKRIVGIGRTSTSTGGSIDNDIPDMYEMPRNSLDIVISKQLGKHWEIGINAKDILCEASTFCQFPKYTDINNSEIERKQVTKSYKPGSTITFRIAAKF